LAADFHSTGERLGLRMSEMRDRAVNSSIYMSAGAACRVSMCRISIAPGESLAWRGLVCGLEEMA
jgi:hypothetical protein